MTTQPSLHAFTISLADALRAESPSWLTVHPAIIMAQHQVLVLRRNGQLFMGFAVDASPSLRGGVAVGLTDPTWTDTPLENRAAQRFSDAQQAHMDTLPARSPDPHPWMGGGR